MKKTQYKLNEKELKHGWHKMSQAVRDKLVAVNLEIINDPNSSVRAIGIATKNLIAINKQNMELDDNVVQQQDIKIEIKEV